MKKILTGILIITLIATSSAFALASNGEKTAMPSLTKFVMDGKEVSLDSAYLIDNSNYLQLRSVAELLSGTKSQFNVYWDNDLRQAVIETGKPYTGTAPAEVAQPDSPQSYKVGDTITFANATIRMAKITTADSTPPDEYGSKFLASSGHTLLCINFEVTANDLNYNNTLWYPIDFIRYATAASGINYEMPFSQGTSGFGANVKKTSAVYIEVPVDETIISVVISDGRGESVAVSVQ